MQGPPHARRASACSSVLGAFLVLALRVSLARAAEPAQQTPAPATTAPHEAPHAPELTLAWQAPTGCPTPIDVETQFVRLLGGATRSPSGKHIEASALVRSSSPDHWNLELATVLDGAVGRRSLSSDSCASVSSAASLILALMIDPAAAERALLAPPTSAPATTTPPVAARAPEAIVSAAPTPAPRALHVFARVFGGGVVALLPTPAPAAGLALGARHRWLAGELSFVASEERRVSADAEAGDFRLLVGGARACGALGGRVVLWQLCAGGEVERLTGTGVSGGTRTETILMGAGIGGLLVTLPLGARVGLTLDLDGALRIYHPAFAENDAQIFRIPLLSAFAALGIIVTI
jgi:hypothetical protein